MRPTIRPARRLPAPALAALLAALLAACAQPPVRPATEPVLTPPAALKLAGVPPVPASLPARVGRYTEFRGASLLDWSPDGRSLLVAWRQGDRVQLHTVAGARAALLPVTAAREPTRRGAYLPADGRYLVFERDAGGSEASQVFRLDLASGAETALTPPGQRCNLGPFDAAGATLIALCATLDAAGGPAEQRGGGSNRLLPLDVRAGRAGPAVLLPGTGWFPVDVAPDGRSVLLLLHRSGSDSEVWRVDLAGGGRHRLLPRAGDGPGYHAPIGFAADGRRLFVATALGGEFRQLHRYDPATQAFEPLAADLRWDVTVGTMSRDRSRLAAITSEAGRGVLRLYDAATLAPLPSPVPLTANVTTARLSADGRRLAYAETSSSTPSEVKVAALDGGATAAQTWVAADLAGMDPAGFAPTEVVAWPSFDGRMISGLVTRPAAARFPGPRPVLIDIHGGPEAQARIGFQGRDNYIVNELGIALVEPNVRGSAGFGKTFIALDDGTRREDAVRDIGALLDWIAGQPDLDATRVAVTGGSYGGYLALATAVHYPDRIRAAIDVVGISHFVSFLERTESYRRDLRRSEYGDERDPALRAFLHAISPLTNAHRIRVPLFVLHGRNDPRVPVQEAEQIAARVAANGVPVWTLIADNEGHGFAKKENADYAFYARLLFLERYLLGR